MRLEIRLTITRGLLISKSFCNCEMGFIIKYVIQIYQQKEVVEALTAGLWYKIFPNQLYFRSSGAH